MICGFHVLITNGVTPIYFMYFKYFWRRNVVIFAYFWFVAIRTASFFNDKWLDVLVAVIFSTVATMTLPAADLIFTSPRCRPTMRYVVKESFFSF